jgi:hypothetical protein
MPKVSVLLILSICFAVSVTAQDTLPRITVKNLNGQIIVSWVNNYKAPVTTINIQRSYDSLKNYTTIGSVLNPQNIENGYADATPPYNKMYYRVFVSFEGGSYLFSKVVRPVKEKPAEPAVEDTMHPFLVKDNWAAQGISNAGNKPKTIGIQPKPLLPPINSNTEIITYPSRRIFTARDNNIAIVLPDADTKKYQIKFFDENDVPLFEINKVTDTYLILERVNFKHAGWFHFEVFENGKLIEKNKFQIVKEGKY